VPASAALFTMWTGGRGGAPQTAAATLAGARVTARWRCSSPAPSWPRSQRPTEVPRVFRTGKLRLIHATSCPFRYSSRTSCGVR
jgi:hypothetical protein